MFSRRINNIKSSFIVKYNALVKKREKQGIVFIRANIGQPNFKTDNKYFQSLSSINKNITNGYSFPEGLDKLRFAVGEYYNNIQKKIKFNKKNVIVTQGASDAIIKVLYALCDKNDEVIVLEPFFSDYKIYADILEIKLVSIPYKDISLKNLNEVFSTKTRAILFANPNNPDGAILTKKDINLLIEFSKNNKLFIISDEVYSGFIYNFEFNTLAEYDYENIAIIDSASKKLNSCGSRIGYVISKNLELLKRVTILNDSKISISNAEQIAVSEMLQISNLIITKSCKIYKTKLDKICKLLNKYKIKYIIPKGGISILIELPIKDCEKYVYWLVNEFEFNGKSILVTPAKEFYLSNNGANKIRLSLTIKEKEIEELVKIIALSICQYEGE